MIGTASQNLIKHANKYGPKHFQNVRNSLQFAFNTSSMSPPKQVETLTPAQALEALERTTKAAELMYAVKDGQIALSVAGKNRNGINNSTAHDDTERSNSEKNSSN